MQRLLEKRPNLCFSLQGGAFTPNIYLIFPPMKEQKHLMQKPHRRLIGLQGKGKKKNKKENYNRKASASYNLLVKKSQKDWNVGWGGGGGGFAPPCVMCRFSIWFCIVMHTARRNSPPHLPPASVSLPRNQKGGHSRLRVRGWGSQFRRLEKKPSTLSTLCLEPYQMSSNFLIRRKTRIIILGGMIQNGAQACIGLGGIPQAKRRNDVIPRSRNIIPRPRNRLASWHLE
jgi:hypothetical protein